MTMDHDTVTDRCDTLELEEVALRAPQDPPTDKRPSVEGRGAPLLRSAGLPRRERLPDRRRGYTQKARVGDHKIYLRTGEYRRRPPWRDLHPHAQGRRGLPVADEQFCDRRVARPAIRRAAREIRRRLHLHPLRAGRPRRRQRQDRDARPRSSTTFFASWPSPISAATTSRRINPRKPVSNRRRD